MNSKQDRSVDEYVALKLMEELSSGGQVTQRGLSDKLGVALGLVNTYLKHFVRKGFIRITQYPSSRYGYLLTPEGMAEKSRLLYNHIAYYTNLFRSVRTESLVRFRTIEADGCRTVAFCGIDELAEIALLSLQQTSLRLVAAYDDERQDGEFFGVQVKPLSQAARTEADRICIIALKRGDEIARSLECAGVDRTRIVRLGVAP